MTPGLSLSPTIIARTCPLERANVMPRPAWKGHLRLNLVTAPVVAYSADTPGMDIHLHQLHAECNSRVKYQKTCPVHGPLSADEIVSGYEYAKDQYVIIDPTDLDKVRSEDEKAINIDAFVTPNAVDPLLLTGKSFYLVPEGKVGQHAYNVVRQGMEDERRYAVATVVMHGHDQLVMLRPLDGLLVMSVLAHEGEVKTPATFTDDVSRPELSAEEKRLGQELVKATTADRFNLAKYKNLHRAKLMEAIEAKVSGKELVAPPAADEQAQVINLMDALKLSVAKAAAYAPPPKPPKKMASSKSAKPKSTRKRRSS